MSQSEFDEYGFGDPVHIDMAKVQGIPRKQVQLQYDTHALEGKLLLVSPEDFTYLHSRFFDIHPSDHPRLDDNVCQPWVLLHSVLGKTWMDVGLFSQPAYFLDAFDVLGGAQEPSFVTFTDNPGVFGTVDHLGHWTTDGCLTHAGSAADHVDELIIAMASHRPFHGLRTLEPRRITRRKRLDGQSVIDYPPLAVHPSLLNIIEKINAACTDPASSVESRPKKQWINANLPELNDGRYMSDKHALYKHRGNEAVFARDVWHVLCFPVGWSEEKAVERREEGRCGGEKIPEPYYQVLFEDMQARERVEGTTRLKGLDYGPETEDGDIEMVDHSLENAQREGG